MLRSTLTHFLSMWVRVYLLVLCVFVCLCTYAHIHKCIYYDFYYYHRRLLINTILRAPQASP